MLFLPPTDRPPVGFTEPPSLDTFHSLYVLIPVREPLLPLSPLLPCDWEPRSLFFDLLVEVTPFLPVVERSADTAVGLVFRPPSERRLCLGTSPVARLAPSPVRVCLPPISYLLVVRS
jgi:hypothetical protein